MDAERTTAAEESQEHEIDWARYAGTLYDDDVVRSLEGASVRAVQVEGVPAGATLTGMVSPTWKAMLVEVVIEDVRRLVVVLRSGAAGFLAPLDAGVTYRFEVDTELIAREGCWPNA